MSLLGANLLVLGGYVGGVARDFPGVQVWLLLFAVSLVVFGSWLVAG